MSNSPSQPEPSPRREWLVIALVTVIAGLSRLVQFGHLGLTHFDEGIYALAGGWVFQKAGLAAIDPGLIPYAPPLYVILVGWAYQFLGPSDVSAILVSVITATASVPVLAWVARRTFGPGAGAVAAVFIAVSGSHVGFSRMALTDVTFLLTWLIAWSAGLSFLRRPDAVRAVLLGLAVGLAQLTKYNGWLAGAIVAAVAVVSLVVDAGERRRERWVRVFGFGLLAGLVAAVVYWPWFSFVERHGGYKALLDHQRSYLSGYRAWPENLLTQWGQETVLGGSDQVASVFLGLIALLTAIPSLLGRRRLSTFLVVIVGLIAASNLPNLGWWVGLLGSFWWIRSDKIERRYLAVAWLTMAVLTPLYHPYARLWLPLASIGWVGLGCLAEAFEQVESALARAPKRTWAVALLSVPIAVSGLALSVARRPIVGSAGEDTLRLACASLARSIPSEVRSVRVLARPPVIFYLSGRVASRRLPDLKALSEGASPGELAIIDEVQVLQEASGRQQLDEVLRQWDVVQLETNTVGDQTRLDIEPVTLAEGTVTPPSRLWLLRYAPKPPVAPPVVEESSLGKP